MYSQDPSDVLLSGSPPSMDLTATPKTAGKESADMQSPRLCLEEQEWSSSCTQSLSSPVAAHTEAKSTTAQLEKYAYLVHDRMEYSCDMRALAQCMLQARANTTPLNDSEKGVFVADVPWFVMMHRWAAEALDAESNRSRIRLHSGGAGAAQEKAQNIYTARQLFAPYLLDLGNRIISHVYGAHTRALRGWVNYGGECSPFPEEVMKYAQSTALDAESMNPQQNMVPPETGAVNGGGVSPQTDTRTEDTMESTENAKPEDDTASEDARALRAALLSDVDAWITSFLPYTRFAARSSLDSLRLLWNEPRAAASRADVAFRMYATATRANRLDRSSFSRGALLPHAWLRGAVEWARGRSDAVPRPFDTFRLAAVAPDGRHILRAGAAEAEAEVVPEELFDLFWALFGGGPKYLLRGAFRSRQAMVDALRPPQTRVSVRLCGSGRRPAQRFKALLHAPLMETVRRALFASAGEGAAHTAAADESPWDAWKAAVCAVGRVCLFVTHINGVALGQSVEVSAAGSVREAVAVGVANVSVVQRGKDNSLGLRVELRGGFAEDTPTSCGVCGLTNIGNTCYMNSGLQCLSNLTSLRKEIFALPLSEYASAPVTTEFTKLLQSMWSGLKGVAATEPLKTVLGRKEKQFENDDQQDAMEFVEVLLDCMHEELNKVAVKSYRERMDEDKAIPTPKLSKIFWRNFEKNNNTFILKLFFHQSKTRVECLKCGDTTVIFENNPNLSATVATPLRTCMKDVILLLPPVSPVLRLQWRVRMCVEVRVIEGKYVDVAEVKRKVSALLCLNEDENNVKNNTHNRSSSKETSVFKSVEEDNDDVTLDSMDFDTALGSKAPSSDRHGSNDTMANWTLSTGTYILTDVTDVDTCCDFIFQPDQVVSFNREIHAGGSADTFTSSDGDIKRSLGEIIRTALAGHYLQLFTEGNNQPHVDGRPIYAALLPTTNDDEQASLCEGESNSKLYKDSLGRSGGVDVTLGPHYAWYFRSKGFGTCDDDQLCYVERLPTVQQEGVTNHILSRCRILCPDAPHVFYGRPNDTTDRLRVLHTPHDDRLQEQVLGLEGMSDSFSFGKGLDIVGDVQIVMKREGQPIPTPPSSDVMQFRADCFYTGYTHRSGYSDTKSAESVTLDDCLRSTFSPDTLEDEDALYCSKCKGFCSSRVERSIFLLPKCLMISLKRFKARLREMLKNNTTVTFPETLDMAPYMDSEAPADHSTCYRLRGVVYHKGSLSFGHYTAVAFNESAQRWICYDDSSALPLQEPQPPPQGAYILFYERE